MMNFVLTMYDEDPNDHISWRFNDLFDESTNSGCRDLYLEPANDMYDHQADVYIEKPSGFELSVDTFGVNMYEDTSKYSMNIDTDY
ncbi:hypothetical protein, partial [Alteromonas stellipolaris]|uniref:hypothetical protein n=1 Tax=Alteromonas stellipolaris TaxID=233316 RepID=UPI001E1192C3